MDSPRPLDFTTAATRWIAEVTEHRKRIRAHGKVTTKIVDPGNGQPPELHLEEETTFKPGPGLGKFRDPLDAALAWLTKSARNRAANGGNGTFRIESSDRNGIVTFARIIETTIISGGTLDEPSV